MGSLSHSYSVSHATTNTQNNADSSSKLIRNISNVEQNNKGHRRSNAMDFRLQYTLDSKSSANAVSRANTVFVDKLSGVKIKL